MHHISISLLAMPALSELWFKYDDSLAMESHTTFHIITSCLEKKKQDLLL